MAEVVFMAISVVRLWEDGSMIVEKEVLKPHDCREDITALETARQEAGQPALWFGSVLKCPICDARWELREHQRDGVYWSKIVEGYQMR